MAIRRNSKVELVPVAGTVLVGDVAEFDEPRGLGVIEYGAGQTLPFHCTAITDGSRQIPLGSVVAFVVTAGRLGRLEAEAVRPLPGVMRPGAGLAGSPSAVAGAAGISPAAAPLWRHDPLSGSGTGPAGPVSAPVASESGAASAPAGLAPASPSVAPPTASPSVAPVAAPAPLTVVPSAPPAIPSPTAVPVGSLDPADPTPPAGIPVVPSFGSLGPLGLLPPTGLPASDTPIDPPAAIDPPAEGDASEGVDSDRDDSPHPDFWSPFARSTGGPPPTWRTPVTPAAPPPSDGT